MLTEVKRVRQIENEPRRRWFSDDYFDLIVWLGKRRQIIGFQLCYGKLEAERALTWKKETGYTHRRVDSGENERPEAKATPILVVDGHFDHTTIANVFKERSARIDKKVANFVYDKIVYFNSSL